MLKQTNTAVLISFAAAAMFAGGTTLGDIDGAALRIHAGSADDLFGMTVTALSDFDNDGVREYGVSGPSGFSGRVTVYSGATGDVLHELQQPKTLNFFGFAVASMPDVNGDGVDDIAIGSPLDASTTDFLGRVWMFSGATGQPIWNRAGEQTAEGFGWSLAALPDYN